MWLTRLQILRGGDRVVTDLPRWPSLFVHAPEIEHCAGMVPPKLQRDETMICGWTEEEEEEAAAEGGGVGRRVVMQG